MKKSNTKLTYFLRGLGFGIVFVSAVVGISDSRKPKTETVKQELSREEIISKAKELGMVEGVDMKVDALLDASASPNTDESQKNQEQTTSPTKQPSQTDKVSETATPSTTEEPTTVEEGKKAFTIASGQPASEVVRNLVEAGLIDNEKEFHDYLQSNGYGRKLKAGAHQITIDGNYQTIANELCSNQ